MGYSIAKVNLGILKNNLSKVKKVVKNTKICGVVKSNAYGHGLVQVSRAIENMVDFFAVSFVEEGLKLRFSGIVKPILVLIPVTYAEFTICSRYNLSVTVCNTNQIKQIKKLKISLNVHIAVNSGMNRLGINKISQLNDIISLAKNSLINVEGIFSHFKNCEYNSCKKQFDIFKKFVKIAKKYNAEIISHISSSAPAVLYNSFKEDMVRIGILMYGYYPTDKKILNVKPCLKIYAENLVTRKLNKGENLLYGNYNLQSYKKISIIKYGYADGATRCSGKFNNRCMDMSAVSGAKKRVLVLDNAQKLAKEQGTIPYEILVSYTSRCQYIYENNCRKT